MPLSIKVVVSMFFFQQGSRNFRAQARELARTTPAPPRNRLREAAGGVPCGEAGQRLRRVS
jgi:hypothetical protein